MSYYAALLIASRDNLYLTRKYAAMLIAGSPACYMTAHRPYHESY